MVNLLIFDFKCQIQNSNPEGNEILDGEKSCDRTFLAINPCIK